ncbi:MAG: disulfide bond formation protein B [Rhodobacteraceae bacterium]|jgi:disulfide bond formation protein DsbB|nr:disulfide bond formation protein B [Paracoccaceae bacterium]
MTRKSLILLAAGGSAALLAGAFAFQYLGGMAPCALCLWQRWPHAAAVAFGAVGLAAPSAAVALAGAASAAASGGIGVFHTGVERGWWEGPSACSGGSLAGLSGADLLATDGAVDIVRCTEVVWSMGGLSMASWNAILSFGLMALWLAAARARV